MKQPFTEDEEAIMRLLGEAQNQFTRLPTTHPLEGRDWADALHRLQDILGNRVLRRDYPDYFQASPSTAPPSVRPWELLSTLPISDFTPEEIRRHFPVKETTA